MAEAVIGVGLVGGGVRWRRSITGVLAATAGGALVARAIRSTVAVRVVHEPREVVRPALDQLDLPRVAALQTPVVPAAAPAERPVTRTAPVNAARHAIGAEPQVAASQSAAVRALRSLAVVGMVLGVVGAVSLPFGLLRLHQGDFSGDLRGWGLDLPLFHTAGDALWMFLASAAGAGLALLLLVGSVGALGFRRSGRAALLLWACASLGLAAVGCLFYLRWILPPWRSELAQVRGVVDSMVNFGGWALGGCLSITMLILLTRRAVRAAFATRGGSATV